MANNRLFHCLISKNPSHLTKFYNEFGMDFKTVSESFYLSTVAPLCIMEKYSQKKSCLIWSEEICPEFKDAFGLIQLEIIEDIGLIENKCNFNRYVPPTYLCINLHVSTYLTLCIQNHMQSCL